MSAPATAHLSLGANLGERAAALRAAARCLADTPGITLAARSSLYETPPWGEVDQPAFLNAALALRTTLPPHALLDACLALEAALGRARGPRWGPRAIDVDLVDYAGVTLADERLTLPHPRALERAFVLVPLSEIAPDLALAGVPIRAALDRLDKGGVVRVGALAGGPPGE